MNYLAIFKTRPRTELIWAGWGALGLTAGVLVVAAFGAALYPKFAQWAGTDITISADSYASFLRAYRAFFFGIFPAIAFLSAVVAWTLFKNLKRVGDNGTTTT